MTRSTRICDETVEKLDEMFRYCFLMVGLRERNFPNQLETMFLHQFIRENYGGHSVDEVKMAFRMAIKSELDIESEEVTSYENFSVRYVSNIMNSYRRWASYEFRRLEKHIQPTESEMKLLEGQKKEEIHWGAIIEKEYQHFLSFGEEHWKIFPVGLYNQLVKDNVFESELFRKAMPIVRKKVIGEHQVERVKHEMRRFEGEDERTLSSKSKNEVTIKNIQRTMDEYASGEKDGELEVAAKAYCVLQFFKNSKESMKPHVYVMAE